MVETLTDAAIAGVGGSAGALPRAALLYRHATEQRDRERIPMTGCSTIVEREPDSYSVYAPESLGCVATGHGVAEVQANMREAIKYHLEMARERGDDIPPPTTVATASA